MTIHLPLLNDAQKVFFGLAFAAGTKHAIEFVVSFVLAFTASNTTPDVSPGNISKAEDLSDKLFDVSSVPSSDRLMILGFVGVVDGSNPSGTTALAVEQEVLVMVYKMLWQQRQPLSRY